MKKVITIIVKPTDACNFRCLYCFHEDMGYMRNHLSLERFEKLLRLSVNEYETVVLVWHGGEPMMCGIDYYRSAVEIINRVKKEYPSAHILNEIQTNLSLLNDEWIAFFKENDFQVGFSFDGPCHDFTRQSSELVMKNAIKLKESMPNVEALAVISKKNINLIETYNYFANLGMNFKFNAIFKEGAANANDFLLITPQEYIKEVNGLFDYWAYLEKPLFVDLFTNYLHLCFGVSHRVCYNASCLGKWLSIFPDGSLYPCAHSSISAHYNIGNIDEISSLDEAFSSENMAKLLEVVLEKRRKCKEQCPLFFYCQSNCPASQLRNIENGLGDFECAAFKGIFSHIQAFVEQMKNGSIDVNKLNPILQSFAKKYL